MDLIDSAVGRVARLRACGQTAFVAGLPDGARQSDNGSGGALFRAFVSLWIVLVASSLAPPVKASADAGAHGMDEAIEQAAGYLHRAIDGDGRFAYVVDARKGRVDGAGYNLLRHAGTLYALATYHAEHEPSVADRRRLQQALDFMLRCCMRALDERSDLLALWSPAELVGGRRDHDVAKLGGAGLGLVALLSLAPQLEGGVDAALVEGLGNFILSMQQPSGGFYSLYAPERGGRDGRWTSLYYPGEAALGLIMLYRYDGSMRWLEAAVDGLRHLARERESGKAVPPDHWALIATSALLELPAEALRRAAPEGLPADELEWLLQGHAVMIVNAMLADQRRVFDGAPPCAAGGFVSDARTTPAATRLEGLLAIRRWLHDPALRDAVDRAIRSGIGFVRAAQLHEGPARGGFPRVSPRCGSTSARAAEVRIDYVQHALSAMLMLRREERR